MQQLRELKINELSELAAMDARTNATPWSLFNYQQSAEDPTHNILGLFVDDILCGACVYSQVLDQAEILQLCVGYEHQRKGYGYLLLDSVCTELKKYAASQIFLEVMVGNISAINLYQKLGFNVINTRKNYYNVNGKYKDALIMARELV
ncbi:MAG: ribosomal-protein-alanine N-acetyltransferase [Neisseriaceae bacterium]|nr:MAG: ribosomal-protein-alanine N-acetyltransferase [Neisseriaceae bacterium]